MGQTRGIALVVGVVMALGGCWPAPGGGPDRAAYNALERGFDADSVTGFTELWAATTDETGPRGVSHPIVSDGAVFVSSTHSVYAFDEATGATRWAKTPNPATYEVDTELFYDRGNVYVSLRRSEHNWEPAQFRASDGFWFTGELNGRMEAVRTNGSGFPTILLSQFAPTPSGGTAQSGFVFGQGTTFLTENPNPSRLTLGTDRYFHAGTGPGGYAPFEGVQAVATSGYPTGPLWRSPVEVVEPTTPVLSGDGKTLFVNNDHPGGIVALDTATGERRWTAPTYIYPTAAPALAGDVLYVPAVFGVVALSATDGSLLWSLSIDRTPPFDEIRLQPTVAGGVVFVATTGGTVAALPADGGGCDPSRCDVAPLWSASTGSPVTGAPAVSGGKLFVTTQDGRVIAYGLPPT